MKLVIESEPRNAIEGLTEEKSEGHKSQRGC